MGGWSLGTTPSLGRRLALSRGRRDSSSSSTKAPAPQNPQTSSLRWRVVHADPGLGMCRIQREGSGHIHSTASGDDTHLAHLLHWVSGRPASPKSISTLRTLLGAWEPVRDVHSFGGCTLMPLRPSSGRLGAARPAAGGTVEWGMFRQSFGRHPPLPQALELGAPPVPWAEWGGGGRFSLSLQGSLPLTLPPHLRVVVRAMRSEDLPAVGNHLEDWQVVPTGLDVGAAGPSPGTSDPSIPTPAHRLRHLMERVPGRLRNTLPILALARAPAPGAETLSSTHRAGEGDKGVVISIPGIGLLRRELAAHLTLTLGHHSPLLPAL
jgi:hypothetical protein